MNIYTVNIRKVNTLSSMILTVPDVTAPSKWEAIRKVIAILELTDCIGLRASAERTGAMVLQ